MRTWTTIGRKANDKTAIFCDFETADDRRFLTERGKGCVTILLTQKLNDNGVPMMIVKRFPWQSIYSLYLFRPGALSRNVIL